MLRYISYTSQFKKDLKKARKEIRNLSILREVILLLSSNQSLPIIFRDHKLIGNYIGRRECHLEPDFLLIYCLKEDELILERLGSHSNLFKM